MRMLGMEYITCMRCDGGEYVLASGVKGGLGAGSNFLGVYLLW